MELNLHEDLAVVVGGANGIGLAIARAFGQEGARVAIVDRDPATPDKARRLATELGTEGDGWVADVSQYVETRGAYRAVVERWGHPRHVVFAVGAGSGKYGYPFWDLEPSDWLPVLQVNLLGAVHVAHAFGPSLRQAAPGSLIFLSSVAGQIGSQTDPPYSAAKAGLINFAQCAAKDFAPYDVRVNVICPGMIATELNRSVWQAWRAKQSGANPLGYEAWAEEKIRRTTPLGRWQTPDDIAAMAVFLASSQARNITGQTINVDGGQVMHW